MISRIEKAVREWLSEHPVFDGVLWGLAVVVCVAILVWFFNFTEFGAPPEFVYEQF